MKQYIEMMQKRYGPDYDSNPIYQMKVLGDFPDVSEDTLIPWQHIRAAINRNISIDAKRAYRRILGVDVARFGQDITVLYGIDKQKINNQLMFKRIDCKWFSKKPLNYTANQIIELDKQWHFNEIRIDAGGGDLGAGVVDMLRNSKISHKVVPFVAGGKEGFNDEDNAYYLNWKSKAYDYLRMLFGQGRIDIKDEGDLADQLTLLRKDFTTGDKLKILDYDEELKSSDIKHKSPDFADALNIACAPLTEEDVHVLDDEGLIF